VKIVMCIFNSFLRFSRWNVAMPTQKVFLSKLVMRHFDNIWINQLNQKSERTCWGVQGSFFWYFFSDFAHRIRRCKNGDRESSASRAMVSRASADTHCERCTAVAGKFSYRSRGKILSEARQGKKPPYTISITETELTGALMGGIEEGVRDEGWRESSAQSVIHPDRIEVLLKLEKQDRTAEFLIDFVPQIENGGVRLVPVSFQFGDYPIPVSVAERVAGSFFKRDFGITTLSVGEARLSAITLKDGMMEITASPAVSTP
jgi:hypothetical protein